MNGLRKVLVWLYMLNKRLFFKKGFVVLLCLIPVLVFGMKEVAKEDSGVLTVMLCAEDPEDEYALQLIDELCTEESVIRYIVGDKEGAYSAVEKGDVDCAWIFCEDFRSKLYRFAQSGKKKDACIEIVEQEDNVVLQLARTQLYGSLYPRLAYFYSENFLQDELAQEGEILEEQLPEYFAQTAVDDKLFQTVYVGQNASPLSEITGDSGTQSYLLTPLKGLLLVFITLCGFAAVMFYLQDDEKGTLAWIPMHRRMYFSYGYVLVATLDATLVTMISFSLLSKTLLGIKEMLMLLLYVITSACFCNFIREILGTTERLGRCIPLITIVMLILSPIFLDLGTGFVGQYFFPPTYYLRMLQNDRCVVYMLLYTGGLYLAGTLLHYIKVKT